MTIWFDMDGTIANLYKDEKWLEKLENFKTEPYENAERLVEENELVRIANKGFELGIISWCAGYHNNKEYDKAVRKVKKEWLKKNYPNIEFAHIHIVKYGTPKEKFYNFGDILVDDEERNRKNWKGLAIEPKDIEKVGA